MNDPFISGARALAASLRNDAITQEQHDSMYAALAKAAEADNVRCELCDDTALIGTRCAVHFDRSTLAGIVARLRNRSL